MEAKQTEPNQAHESTAVTEALEELAAYLNDSKMGYEKSAQEATNPDHQTIYRQLTEQKTTLLSELNQLIQQHGGATEKSRVIQDELYRQWVDTRASQMGGDDETLVLANQKGEEWALKATEQALGHGEISAADRPVLEKLKKAIQEAQFQLQGMRLSA